MGALAQIDAGVTTLVDWCHNITTLEHAENGGRRPHPIAASVPCLPMAGEAHWPRNRHAVSPTSRIRGTRIEALRKGRLGQRRRPA